ncbi:hypothetical protein D9615_005902 [Tricholomella constricta]|uniref:AA9 family lytic polysaccharide monooxygenase n=1 Tax=Tricholomella constricta TaxID=117010 RepID=A0A8H5H9P1_9AGAR|nr:hypothetical protein D9615_005902 [Tricholomella constricta]
MLSSTRSMTSAPSTVLTTPSSTADSRRRMGPSENHVPASVTLAIRTLAARNFFIRHEILALHLAYSPGGAEFYPPCAQLHIGDAQTATPMGLHGARRPQTPNRRAGIPKSVFPTAHPLLAKVPLRGEIP